MPTLRVQFLLAVLAAALCLAAPAAAVVYLDPAFQTNRGGESCLELDDLFRFEIEFPARGIRALLQSEAELVEFFVKVYGCRYLEDARFPYGRHAAKKIFYLPSVNNRGDDGSYRTLTDLLKLDTELPVFLSNKPVLYPSLAAARGSAHFRDLLSQYPRGQVFIEALDYGRRRHLGLFDAAGRRVDTGP